MTDQNQPVYKILAGGEFRALGRGEDPGSPLDVADGFVHLATAAQARAVAERFFVGVTPLWLVELDPGALPSPLRWEEAEPGEAFPHLSDRLPPAAVTRWWHLDLGDDGVPVLPPLP